MSFAYIKDCYGKSFSKGHVVLAKGRHGVVVKATHYVYVRLSAEKRSMPYHPNDVEPVVDQERGQ